MSPSSALSAESANEIKIIRVWKTLSLYLLMLELYKSCTRKKQVIQINTMNLSMRICAHIQPKAKQVEKEGTTQNNTIVHLIRHTSL